MELKLYLILISVFFILPVVVFYGLFLIGKKAIIISSKLNTIERNAMQCNTYDDIVLLENELSKLRKNTFHHIQYSHCDKITAIIEAKKPLLKKLC